MSMGIAITALPLRESTVSVFRKFCESDERPSADAKAIAFTVEVELVAPDDDSSSGTPRSSARDTAALVSADAALVDLTDWPKDFAEGVDEDCDDAFFTADAVVFDGTAAVEATTFEKDTEFRDDLRVEFRNSTLCQSWILLEMMESERSVPAGLSAAPASQEEERQKKIPRENATQGRLTTALTANTIPAILSLITSP